MKHVRDLIRRESSVIAALHRRVHETFKNRGKDLGSWEKACEEFHNYKSELSPLIDRVYAEPKYSDTECQEFAITFLELNPIFFRSGYIKEEILRKLARSKLSEKQLSRLRRVLISAVEERGTREFKRYCRLSTKVADPVLIEYLYNASRQGHGPRKSRAKLMLNYQHVQKSA